MQKNKNKLIRSYSEPRQSGIALIITIVLTSIMLSSVVLVSREMVDEVRNSTRIDNSLIAYYAAEAGLEDALLEWRYNHDTEISKENDDDPDIDVTADDNNTPRTVNITTDSTDYNPIIYTNSYYDLTMWSKTKSITDEILLRDNVAEFIVPNMTQDLIINWSNPVPIGNNNYRVEITTYNENGEILDAGKFFTNPAGITSQTIPSSIGPGKKIIRVRLWGDPASQIDSIELNIDQSTSPDLITGPSVNIESIGHFGGVARKIIATIDRSSGNIIGINDFAIYSASDLIK